MSSLALSTPGRLAGFSLLNILITTVAVRLRRFLDKELWLSSRNLSRVLTTLASVSLTEIMAIAALYP